MTAVMIGVTSGEFSRFSKFTTSLIGAMGALPPGSGLTWAGGVDVSGNCNQLCRKMLAGSYTHLWVMGDDHDFEPDIVVRLLAHDVDVIVPHCLKRYPPWMPVVFTHQDENGHYVTASRLPETGLTPIHAAGSAGMLIKREVLEAVGDPWFTPSPDSEGLNEDLHFCKKVRDAGFGIYCDPEILLGHIGLHTVKPKWEDGQWHPEFVHDTASVVFRRPEIGEKGIDWDAWRAGYDDMSWADQKAFYNRVADLFPYQQSFDTSVAFAAFAEITGDDLRVVELGGWDGALAKTMLERGGIAEWVNYDIADVPQACTHPAYRRELLTDGPLWDRVGKVSADVLVASHTIEHLRVREVERLFDAVDVDWVFLEAPLQDEPTDWDGYKGSHILEVGWRGIDARLRKRGFAPAAPGLWKRREAAEVAA